MMFAHPQGPALTGMMSVEQAAMLIRQGRVLALAGDEALLRRLPPGHWIGGSIAYFMGEEGGHSTRERLYVTELPSPGGTPQIVSYDAQTLPRLCLDAPANGYTVIILPAFSAVHGAYAREAPGFDDMFIKPVVGWVAGVHLDDLGRAVPCAFDGARATCHADRAVVMHVPLPESSYAQIDIVNLMQPGTGDRIRFPRTGFSATQCLINDSPARFADYLAAVDADVRLPLVASYSGALVNVSFRGVGPRGEVEFYAPVFDDVEYRLAAPLPDYVEEFAAALPAQAQQASFSCNCILNYLHGGLEGRRLSLQGPMTFGEIAYLLLNQTLVYMRIEQVS